MLNRGAVFIVAFRWLMILLAALIIEKGLEGVIYVLTSTASGGEIFFAKSIQDWRRIAPAMAMFFTALLLMGRYFLCAIEPIVASFTQGHTREIIFDHNWQDGLRQIKMHWIVMVALVTGLEFSLFFSLRNQFLSEVFLHYSCFLLLHLIY